MRLEFANETDLHEIEDKTQILQHQSFNQTVQKVEFDQLNVTVGAKEKYSFQLGNIISPNESKNILIVTRGRSGSSFLGDLLSRYPGTFYSYEPLHFNMRTSDSYEKLALIKEVFKCAPNPEYIMHPKSWGSLLNGNFRYNNACKGVLNKSEACYIPDVYYSTCPIFPIRLIKTIRLPFQDAEVFLQDPSVNKTLKIIFLFRDPRGRLQSLKSKVHWCSKIEETNKCNITNLCKDLKRDLYAALVLKNKYPGKIWR